MRHITAADVAGSCEAEARLSVQAYPAVLLSDTKGSMPCQRIVKLLTFFGVGCRTLTVSQFVADSASGLLALQKYRIFSSAETFARLLKARGDRPVSMPSWYQNIHSAFVFADNDRAALENFVRVLAKDEGAEVRKIRVTGEEFLLANHSEFCGAMAGLRIPASKVKANSCFVSNITNPDTLSIISSASGSFLLKLQYDHAPVFVSTSAEIIDIDTELTTQNFDVREHFLAAVPVVLYIKWALSEVSWHAPDIGACLIIDDPVLKPVYGFINFQDLLSMMKRYKFSTSVAFIPWNWRRSSPKVVSLFRENPEYYSISVHGCDHTRAEFGDGNQECIHGKVREAIARMNVHESQTAIPHDRVMVFPQGVFSREAISTLKRSDFVAAVNNDTISADLSYRPLKIRELWDVAVMSYDNFPIFTRRYPWEGIENFAFDILLGKPAIIVIHHDYCSDRCKRLVEFIERLNALKGAIEWQSLGELIRRSYWQRKLSPTLMEVEMYGKELHLENRSLKRQRYLFRRRESEPSSIKEVLAAGTDIMWNSAQEGINFELELEPGENTTVEVRFEELLGNGCYTNTLYYRAKTMLRRYLCELRDNYITPAKFRMLRFMRNTEGDSHSALTG
jgi:hypothetical protein